MSSRASGPSPRPYIYLPIQAECLICSRIYFSQCAWRPNYAWWAKKISKGAKKNTLLPPVVPPFVFLVLPFFWCCRLSKFHLFKTFKLLKYQCTSQWYWCLPSFDLVVEADHVVVPWMVRGQETSMSHVAVLPPVFQPQILNIFVAVWTCKLSFRAPTRKHIML